MKTIDISGFGGGYEATCQRMLLAGMGYLATRPDFDWSGYRGYKNVYGVVSANNTDAMDLDSVLTAAALHDMTGAQHQVVVSHLHYIHQHNYEEWLEEITSCHPERVYDTSPEEIDKVIAVSKAEWQVKLDQGYNPLKDIPAERIITINPDDSDSMEAAVEEIKRRIEEEKHDSPEDTQG